MKILFVIAMSVMLTACGTLGGAISGAGEDLTKIGEWIKDK
jgi:predicted small secreted protein